MRYKHHIEYTKKKQRFSKRKGNRLEEAFPGITESRNRVKEFIKSIEEKSI
jgi:hypothetical protein